MSGISTHILDTALGRPAAGVRVTLECLRDDAWTVLAEAETDPDGRCKSLLHSDALPGTYRLGFATAPYFAAQNLPTLYPHISIAFNILEGEAKYHIPLLLTPNSYTTYRGT